MVPISAYLPDTLANSASHHIAIRSTTAAVLVSPMGQAPPCWARRDNRCCTIAGAHRADGS